MPELSSLPVLFATSLVVGFSGAMMPGPLVTMTVSESAKRGFRAAPLLVVGHGIAELAVVVALAGGLSWWLRLPAVTGTIGLLGGVVLVWMGFSVLRSVQRNKLSLEAQLVAADPGGGHVLTGLVVSVVNPYWLIWWATIGANYVLLSLQAGTPGLVAFYTGHILSDFSWCGLVGLAVVTGRRFISDGVYRGVLAFCAAFLVLLGGYFAASVIPFWVGFLRL